MLEPFLVLRTSIDDLLRRAAEKYPLNINSVDWNKIRKKILNSEKEDKVQGNGKRRGFFWLLFLFPLMMLFSGVQLIDRTVGL